MSNKRNTFISPEDEELLKNIVDPDKTEKRKMKVKKSKSMGETDKDDIDGEEENKEVLKIKKFGFDFYKILGVDKNTDITEIKSISRKLLAKYHPDNFINLSNEQRKQKEQQFQLIQMAQKTLTDVSAKKYYDLQQQTIKEKDFFTQKQSFEDFIKQQESEDTPESRARAQLDFIKLSDKKNKEVGYNPDLEVKLSKHDTDRNLTDLVARREEEEIEITHKNIFEGRKFNPSEFNKIFEKEKRKKEKQTKKGNGELTKYDDNVMAFNNTKFSDFVGVNDNYEVPFSETGDTLDKLFSDPSNVSSPSESEPSDYEYNDDYNKHNHDKAAYQKLIEKKLLEREQEDKLYDNRERSDFNNNIMDIPDGISKEFGTMIGKDITSTLTRSKKIDIDLINAYNKMIGYDKKE